MYIYMYIYIYNIYMWYEYLQICDYATASFMLTQFSGIVGLTLFSCYLKARKECTKYHQIIHDINLYYHYSSCHCFQYWLIYSYFHIYILFY